MRHRRPRGFTLLELMIALGASAVVLTFVMLSVNAQQRAFTSGGRQRAAQMSARSAMLLIEEELALAGYGMDAPLAFDFDRYQGPCPAELGTCPRDSIENSDEIVFFRRNPLYWVTDDYDLDPRGNAWRITPGGVTGTTVTVSAQAGDTFLKGEILQAVCPQGGAYAYFTVGATSKAAAAGTLAIGLAASVASDPFRRQDYAATVACLGGGRARLFRIQHFRFHVRPVKNGATYTPYLVLDRGVDSNGDDAVNDADEEILAEGVELLQFAYVLTNAALAPRGTTPGTAVTLTPGFPGGTTGTGLTTLQFPGGTVAPGASVYGLSSFYGYSVGPPPHKTRTYDHQANIRAVRVAIRARSEFPDPQFTGGDVLVPLLNLDRLPAWITTDNLGGRFNRATFETTVPIRNMVTRGMPDF